MPHLTLWDDLDDKVPGGLVSYLNDAREAEQSFLDIAMALREEHGVRITPETVRVYCGKAAAMAATKATS